MSTTMEAKLSAAGAIVSADPGTQKVVPYVARSYSHPALQGRTVVRILPQALQEAEDLALSTMGLESESESEIGFSRRIALGFPAWPLIHDPANAGHALALVKDLERIARLAKAKPGAAKNEVDVLAIQLDSSAPHFLPTFMEEVGRIYIRFGNAPMAGQFFGRARTAERVHNLAIDEERHREVFLEFAFAGALTAKAMTVEATELLKRVASEEAYALFRQLSIERIKGGLPPYAGMAKDLRAVAKAAKLDTAAEDKAIIAELLSAPATKRAVKGFWTAYAKAIAAAAKENADLLLSLLNLFPDELDSATWVRILRAAGAVELAKDGAVDLAVWLGRLIDHHHCSEWTRAAASPELQALTAELASLIREQKAVGQASGVVKITTWRSLDLDLLDVLAEHGIEAELNKHQRFPFDVSSHIRRENNARSLEHLAAATRWRPLLQKATLDSLRNDTRPDPHTGRAVASDERIALLGAYPGLRQLVREMLTDSIGLATSSLINFGQALDLAEILSSTSGMAMVGDLVAELPQPNAANLVADVFNAGILDELGWEAYERVLADYRSNAKNTYVDIRSAWPHALISTGSRATVVSRDGVIIDHTVHVPKEFPVGGYNIVNCVSVGSDLLVHWQLGSGDGNVGYWASNPSDIFKVDGSWIHPETQSLPTASGGRTLGHRDFQAGERGKPKARSGGLAGDGQHFWVGYNDRHKSDILDDQSAWQELDVSTGALGKKSYPAFLAEISTRRGHTIRAAHSIVRPLFEDFAENPLGWAAGTVGHCWYTNEAGETMIERTDGVKAGKFTSTGSVQRDEELVSGAESQLLSLPGNAMILATPKQLINVTTGTPVGLTSGTGRFQYVAGTPDPVGPDLRHNLRPRHVPTSERLRVIEGADLGALLAVAETGPATDSTMPAAFSEAEISAIAALFPGSPPALTAGILGILRGAKGDAAIAHALRSQARASLADGDASHRDKPTSDEPRHAQTRLLTEPFGLEELTGKSYRSGPAHSRTLFTLAGLTSNMTAAAATLGITPSSAAIAPEPGAMQSAQTVDVAVSVPTPVWVDIGGAWIDVFQSPAALIAKGMAAGTSVDDKLRIALILGALADSGLADTAGQLCAVRVRAAANQNLQAGQLLKGNGGNVLLVAALQQSHPVDESKSFFAAIAQGTPVYGKLDLDLMWSVPAEANKLSAEDLRTASTLLHEAADATERTVGNAQQIQALVDGTGMLEEEAEYMLAGLPTPRRSWGNPDTDFAKGLGLTETRAKLALDTLESCDRYEKRLLWASLVPDRVADFFSHGADADKAIRAWTAVFGAKIEADPEILRSAFSDLKGVSHSVPLTRWALSPEALSEPNRRNVLDYLQACLWLAYNLPAGHPGRLLLPQKIAAVRGSLAYWREPLEIGADYDNSFRTAHGLPSKPRGAQSLREKYPPLGRDSVGIFTADYDFHIMDGWWNSAFDRITVDAAKFTAADLHVLGTLSHEHSTVRMLRTLFDEKLDNLCAALATEDHAKAGPLPNPLISAPGTVAHASQTLGLTEDAAVLFLQLLALPDPTNARVQKWNGWTPARRTKAGAEVEGAKLVVRAKRARAGRDLFLDGGWVTLRGASLPLEAWKTELYGLPAGDKPELPMDNFFLSESLPQLFQRAWLRYESGDKPRYAELQTGHTA